MMNSKNNKPQVSDASIRENNTVKSVPRNGVQGEVISTSYTGPIPPPAILKGYAAIKKDLPDRIFKEFEKNSEHMRKQDARALEAQIAEKQRGQWMAFVISILLLAVVLYSLYIGNYIFAGSSGLAYLAFLGMSFLSRTNIAISGGIKKKTSNDGKQ